MMFSRSLQDYVSSLLRLSLRIKLIRMEDHQKKLSLSIGRYIESCIHALVKRYFETLKLNWPRLMETPAL